MSWIHGMRERLRPLLDRVGLQSELDEEMEFHFEREVERNVAAGMSPREARRAARSSMGGAFRPAEDVRAVWKGYDFGGLGQELRLAARRLRRRPGFTAVATITLALGIGANTAIFSLVRSVLVRPLPYAEPESIGFIWDENRARETWLSAREWMEYRDGLAGFDDVATYTDYEASLTGDADPERVPAAAVTANALPLLGVTPVAGRLFLPEDDVPNASPVAILSHDLWQRRYGGDPAIVGGTITANGTSTEVIGVLPPEFRLPLDYRLERPTELFAPAGIDETANLSWGNRGWFVFGRLAAGTSAELATSEIRALGGRWVQEGFVDEDTRVLQRSAVPVADLLLAEMRTPLLILMGAVGLILLIACANVAHLLLARSEARRGEVAVAAALGASRIRLARQHLVENGLLAGLGAILGIGLAGLVLQAVVALTPVGLIRMRGVELDLPVLLFAAVLTVATTMVAGLVPALRSSGIDLLDAMRGTRGTDRSAGRRGVRRLLVALESALAVVLVIGAALLARSFVELNRIDLGFDDANVLVGGITLPSPDYPENAQVGTFFRELSERLERLPGVEAAGAVRSVPLGQSIGTWTVTLEDPPPNPDEDIEPSWQIVSPGYFDALRLEVVEGRFFSREARAGGRPVAVISETMANRYWPDASPVGRRFHLGGGDRGVEQPWVEIVGVARTVRHNDVLEEPRVEMYLPHEQWPEIQGTVGSARRTMSLVVRTAGDPLAVLPAVRREIGRIDASVPLANPRTMSSVTGSALAEQRFTAAVFGSFAGLALLLAAVGLYGVTAYSTSRRTNELGIRLALGAEKRNVAGIVLKEAVAFAGLGVIAGGLAAAWLTRFLSSQLYGISRLDAGTFVAVPFILIAVAALAAWVPAHRATRIDPALALRSEG